MKRSESRFKIGNRAKKGGELNLAEYQQFIFNKLGYFAVSRHCIPKNKQGNYFIKSLPSLEKMCFYFTFTNTLVKAVYILYFIYDKSAHLKFLDKMAAGLYILIFGIMSIAYSIWFWRYPLFEILYRFWNIQQSIYANLGCPPKMKTNIDKKLKATFWVHLIINWTGCICFLIQYNADPKYYTFTYALISEENLFLWTVFGVHEFLFMFHAWNLMTISNCLFTFQGIVLTNLIDGMTNSINRLSREQEMLIPNKSSNTKYSKSVQDGGKDNNVIKIAVSPVPDSMSKQGWGYENIHNIISDYKHLMLINEMYNEWVSYKTVFLHVCGYFQFIADVFLAVQVLRLPHTGITDIWFYIEDSLASMYMIYRVYNNISRVEPASREFFNALDHFLKYANLERKYLVKVMKTLKMVTVNLGPCPVTRETVLSAMEILGNYYICVALW